MIALLLGSLALAIVTWVAVATRRGLLESATKPATMLLLIAWFVWSGANSEARMVRRLSAYGWGPGQPPGQPPRPQATYTTEGSDVIHDAEIVHEPGSPDARRYVWVVRPERR